MKSDLNGYEESYNINKADLKECKNRLLKQGLALKNTRDELNQYKMKDITKEYLKDLNLDKLRDELAKMNPESINENLFLSQRLSLKYSREYK